MKVGLAIAGSVLGFVGAAGAQTPGLYFTGLRAGATQGTVTWLSQNGAVAVGWTYGPDPAGTSGFRWTQQAGRFDYGLLPGMPDYTPANTVSSDGSVLAGRMVAGPGQPDRAYRWTGNGPLEDLGVLPGNVRSYANGISGDGATVVGACEYSPWHETYGQAFRWTSAGGMQGLGYTRPGSFFSQARGVSRDGSTIIGQSNAPDFIFDAFVWRQGTGMQIMPGLPGPVLQADATAVNANGTVVVGLSITNTPQQYSHAVRWINGEITDLGSLPGLPITGAYAVSDSGDVIGGGAFFGLTEAAFVWTPTVGIQFLSDYLGARGFAVPAGYRLEQVNAISGDGLTFAGEAQNLLTGTHEGFVATIPSPASILILTLPALARRRRAPRHASRSIA